MSFLSWLADRLILAPSRNPIDSGDKKRHLIDASAGCIESWVGCFPEEASDFDLVIVKFPGTAGRAERAGVNPAEIWQPLRSEIWAINPYGYGGSSGRASVKLIPDMVTSVWQHIAGLHPDLPLVVVGNSLGCVSALHAASNFNVAAVVLRNPPPLQQMICERPRYSAWNFGLSRFIATEVPDELDTLQNARRCDSPCLFIQSQCDSVVPVEFQNRIFENYAGPKEIFKVVGAEHHEPVGEDQQDEYFAALGRLKEKFFK